MSEPKLSWNLGNGHEPVGGRGRNKNTNLEINIIYILLIQNGSFLLGVFLRNGGLLSVLRFRG